MTSPDTSIGRAGRASADVIPKPLHTQAPVHFQLPDPPERHPDEVTSQVQLTDTGHAHHIAQYLGNPDTTLVTGDRWIVPDPDFNRATARRPDLLVAFNASPQLYRAQNGYIVSEQGKAPDFVLEVASESTASNDLGVKKDYYETLGIGEYWLFDHTGGDYYRARLLGYRLEAGRYVAIPVTQVGENTEQGYSAALGLHLRGAGDELQWIDPATEEHIATFTSERARADREEARANREEARADREEARANRERETRIREQEVRAQAEARIRELEERLHQLEP